MNNDKSKTKGKAVKTNTKDEPPILSEMEIKNTVREFILAWIRGEIIINFPTESEFPKPLFNFGFFRNIKTDDTELKVKLHFADLVAICLGTEKATSKERKEAISSLFKQILYLRLGGRINGKFMEFNTEKRFLSLERQVKDTNNLVKEILIAINTFSRRKS